MLEVKDVLDSISVFVIVENEAAQVEDEIQEIQHVVSYYVVAYVFSSLQLLVIDANSYLYAFAILSDQ